MSVLKISKLVVPLLTILLIVSVVINLILENSLRTSTGKTSTFKIDSKKEIEITISDSIKNFISDDFRKNMKRLIDNTDRFDIDTVSTLNAASLALDGKARNLQKNLMSVLPKISLTTGKGENKFTRNYYIIEGDIKVDRDELYYYCLKRLVKQDTSITDKIASRKLTIVTDKSGNPSIWPVGITIKYCVMRSSFSSKSMYDTAIKTMREATKDWMGACNIKFQYVPNLDNSEIDLESFPDQILFIVRQLNVNGEFIAQSFFPADPQFKRMLLLDNSFFTSPFNKTGVMRHELGHILGFRHEQIWSNDASCRGESIIEGEIGAKPVTKYDPFSVMHYPCGQNMNNRVIGLTSFDIEGSRKIYPFN